MSKVSLQTRSEDVHSIESQDNGTVAGYRRAGAFVFVSGSGHLSGDSAASPDVKGGIRQQTTTCIENLRAVLEEAGGGLENLVEVTTYLANMNDYGGYNDIYSKYFTPDGPARTTVAVHQLSRPNALIEIRGTAYIAEATRAQG
ncbi:MAG: RidA family protein [Alphaproteobacteria bacterium]|nr:RidA family protein [Alphaproteobacteria bacterium]